MISNVLGRGRTLLQLATGAGLSHLSSLCRSVTQRLRSIMCDVSGAEYRQYSPAELTAGLERLCLPSYAKFPRIPGLRRSSPYACFAGAAIFGGILGCIFSGLGLFTAVRAGIGYLLWVDVAFLVLTVTFGLWALGYARIRLLRILPAVVATMPEEPESRKKLTCDLVFGYRCWQKCVFVSVVALIAAVVGYWLRWGFPPHAELSVTLRAFGAVAGLVAGWVGANGLWLAMSSARFTRTYSSTKGLRLNPYWPETTQGLRLLSQTMSLYALMFFLEVSLFLIPFAALSLRTAKVAGPEGFNWPMVVTASFLLIGVLMIPIYYFYPQRCIRAVASASKLQFRFQIETELAQGFSNDLPSDGLSRPVELLFAHSVLRDDNSLEVGRYRKLGLTITFFVNLALALLANQAITGYFKSVMQ